MNDPEKIVKGMYKFRNFPDNTCPASRHVQMIAEGLYTTGAYPLLQDDPQHCATSIASVVSSLYQARSFLLSLGYSWSVNIDGDIEWKKDAQEIDPV
jgi:hypothetical protein